MFLISDKDLWPYKTQCFRISCILIILVYLKELHECLIEKT